MNVLFNEMEPLEIKDFSTSENNIIFNIDTIYANKLYDIIQNVVNNISSIKVYNNENIIFQTSLFNNFKNLIIKNENNNLQVNISI